ncbi:MAG: radical SAM protein, partial [Anaerovoracaceae bacterium]
LTGQTEQSMRGDVETGLRFFERVCVNLMTENSTDMYPDREVLDIFMKNIYPAYRDDPRVDILIENTDFGVGGNNDAK